MVDASTEMDFAFMAGSLVPIVQRIPPVGISRDDEVDEVVCVALGGIDGYDIRALEGIQGMVERREGGESVLLRCMRCVAMLYSMRWTMVHGELVTGIGSCLRAVCTAAKCSPLLDRVSTTFCHGWRRSLPCSKKRSSLIAMSAPTD